MSDAIETQHDYERLRAILEKKRGAPVTIEEATKIGDDLLELYSAFLSEEVMVQSEA